jgi:hypothetical protein
MSLLGLSLPSFLLFFLSLPIRKEWDDLSGKLQAHFNLDELVGKRDDSIYRQAKSLLHELTIKTSTFSNNASKGGGLSCRILASLLMFFLTSGKNNKSKAPHTVGTDGMQNSKKPPRSVRLLQKARSHAGPLPQKEGR